MTPATKNCFDPMRHIAALAVLVSHHFALSEASEPALNPFYSWGSLAVLAFFSISGFLITQSFLSSNSVGDYFKKRCARIFPALLVCSFLMVYPGQLLFGSQAASAVLGDIGNIVKFLKISLFARADIPAITDGFRFTESFNGSLWSLKIEFACYVLIALGLTLCRKPIIVYLMAAAAVVATWALLTFASGDLAAKLAIYGSVTVAFLSGSALYFKKELFLTGKKLLGLCAASCLALAFLWNSKYILAFGGIAFCCIFLAIGVSFSDRLIKRQFDFSYGMYIYAFPVQQILINKTELSFISSMVAAVILTTILAAISWYLIERPALRIVHGIVSKNSLKGLTKAA